MSLGAFNNKLKIVAASLVLILFSISLIVTVNILSQNTFYKGIYIAHTDVSGLNIYEARNLLENRLKKEYENCSIKLVYKDSVWEYNLEDMSIFFLTEKALKTAYDKGRTGNVFQRLYDIASLNFKTLDLDVQLGFDDKKIIKILKEIKEKIDKPEKNASVKIQGQKAEFIEDVTGYSLDLQINYKKIEDSIKSKKFDIIPLLVEIRTPRIQFEQIKDMKEVISSFSTTFSTSNSDRSYNIKLACNRINNSILMPGEVFSMDTALGARTLNNGYREAPVIFKNELIPGIGGGVCQVTTTLYVAVLKSLMEVVERTPHSLTLAYVDPGQDATIVENSIDFKFRNSKDYPICIGAEVKGSSLNISIIGKKDPDLYTVKLKSKILATYEPGETEYIIDNDIQPGTEVVKEKARKGYKVAVYRELYDLDGNLIKSEKISEDVYRPVKGIIKVNENYFSNPPAFISTIDNGLSQT